jgi:phosphoglycerate dehydrogenase-like enzyme
MPLILSDIPCTESSRQRLATFPQVALEILPRHEGRWDVPDKWLERPEILLCHFPPGNLHQMTNLKLLQLGTVGYEHMRDMGLADTPLRVCNARGVFDTAIGEWNLAMMINLTRGLRTMLKNQEQARWDRQDCFEEEIRGRVVGLWGYGGIGRETARLARAFGMTVHVMTRTGVRPRHNAYVQPGSGDPDGVLPDRVFIAGQQHDFLSGLDFLVLALPRTRLSSGMIGEAELQALPRTAFVLNPARGPIIQEQALLRALTEGWIAGAAIDTHYAYPLPPEHPLWRFPNVILTPHIAGADKSRNFVPRLSDLFAENVSRYLAGRPLLNELTREEWREI